MMRAVCIAVSLAIASCSLTPVQRLRAARVRHTVIVALWMAVVETIKASAVAAVNAELD